MADDLEVVRLTFDGGLAKRGRIHLYEYSRSQYALSRFINTVEIYRRSGYVADKITKSRAIDMIVAAPEKGTFHLEIFVPIAAELMKQAQEVSFKALFSYVWERLIPHSEKRSEIAVQLATVELQREQERTRQVSAQQGGETERLRIVADIVAGHGATTRQLIELFDRASNSPDVRMLQNGVELSDIEREREFLIADAIREEAILKSEPSLKAISDSDMNKLIAKLRPMVSDIALPLRRSAERCYIGDAANENSYVRLDEDRVIDVTSRELDDDEYETRGLIRSWDRYTFNGKIEQSNDFDKTMYYVVENENRDYLRPKLIAALRSQIVTIRYATYRDAAGNITSLVLRDIIPPA
jgi:hypothetical protein